MANQSKILPSELLPHILKWSDIKTKVKIRRVNKQFKQVVEKDVWQPKTKLILDGHIEFFNRVPKIIFEIILSNMPNLKKLTVPLYDEDDIFDYEDQEPSKEIIYLLAKYCPRIQHFTNCGYTWITQYVSQLLHQGIIPSRDIVLNYDLHQHIIKKLESDGYKISFRPDYSELPKDVQDKLLGTSYEENMPYLSSLHIINHPKLDDDDFVHNFGSQITDIWGMEELDYCKYLNHFVNLVSLDLVKQTWVKTAVKKEDEFRQIKFLERYLKSENSRHLIELHVDFQNNESADGFVRSLSKVARPKKWKQISIESDHYELKSLGYIKKSIVIRFPDPRLPKSWIVDLLNNMRCVNHISLCAPDYGDVTMLSQVDVEDWRFWIEEYASKHRNQQIQLHLFKLDMKNYNVSLGNGRNWCIFSSMIPKVEVDMKKYEELSENLKACQKLLSEIISNK